jgi:uncharacterized protein YcnI
MFAGAVALAATLAPAGPAFAHAEVEADTPRALAENVTLSFVSEAESDSAGFTRLRVVLPEGIAPGDVRLDAAPEGWKLKSTGDGYTLGGPALKAGVDAEHSIKVRQLPDAKEIAFKTVETYSDGEISRWIELPDGGSEPEQPAPVLKLTAAAPGAKPAATVPAAPSPAPSAAASGPSDVTPGPSDATPASSERAAEEAGGSSTAPLVAGVAVAVVVLGGGAWWLVRRRSGSAES